MVVLILRTIQIATVIQLFPSTCPAILAFVLFQNQSLIITFVSNVQLLVFIVQAKQAQKYRIHVNATKLLPSIRMITLAAAPL